MRIVSITVWITGYGSITYPEPMLVWAEEVGRNFAHNAHQLAMVYRWKR